MLLASCASSRDAGPEVWVSAAREPDGVRVRFRRAKRLVDLQRARLERDGGALDEIAFSPDFRTVSVLWRRPAGELRCFYPLGGVGRFAAGAPTREDTVRYVLLDAPGVEVRMELSRACTMRPVLPLDVRVDDADRPATLYARDAVFPIDDASVTILLELPRSARNVLEGGDLEVVLKTATGAMFTFLVGVDPDGTPTATTGYIETGQGS